MSVFTIRAMKPFRAWRRKSITPMTLAKISGHKDVKILLNTYYNPQGEDLAGLLD